MKKTLVLTEMSKAVLALNTEIVTKWCAGLRSGKWIQTTGKMTDPNIPNSACCLMVLEGECNNHTTDYYLFEYSGVINVENLPSSKDNPLFLSVPSTDTQLLPERLTSVIEGGDGHTYAPAAWNDILKLSFEQIATLLETGSVEFETSIE